MYNMDINEIGRRKTNNIQKENLRGLFGPKRNTKNKEYKQRTNADLREMFNEFDRVCVIKGWRLSWTEHMWRVEDRIVYKVTM